MKAIILARVSTEEQMTEGQSIPAQLARAQEYAKKKNLEVISEYQFDESSTKDQRKKFGEVIEDIKKSKEQIALIVETIDRLQRGFKESVVLDVFRKEGKLEIHFVRENLVISKDSNSSEIMRWDMGVMFAKNFVLQIGDNVKRTFTSKIANGEIIGKSPIGYKNEDAENGGRKAVPDPVRAPLIVKIFELYASGNHSMKTVAQEMEKAGLRSNTPNQNILKVRQIEYILKNPFYYGFRVYKGQLHPHKYEPLISYDLFLKCQRIREARQKKPTKYASKQFAFKGLIICKKCGCAITPEQSKGIYNYYHCTNHKKICEKVWVKEEDLFKPIMDDLSKIKLSQSKIDELIESFRISEQAKNGFYQENLKKLRKEQDLIEKRKKIMYDDRLDGRITTEMYDIKLKEFEEQISEILSKMIKYNKADESFHITANHLLSLAQRAVELFKSSEPEKKRQLLNFAFQNFGLSDRNLSYKLKTPLEGVLIGNTTNNWGG